MRRSGSAPAEKATDGRPFLNSSQVFEWLKCRYRWNLGVYRHIGSRAFIRPLELGTLVHAGLAKSVHTIASARTTKAKIKLSKLPAVITAAIELGKGEILDKSKAAIELRGGAKAIDPEEDMLIREMTDTAIGILVKQVQEIDFGRFRTVTTDAGVPVIELSMNMPLPKAARGRFAGYHGTPDWVAEDMEVGAVFNIDYKVRSSFTPPEAEEVNLQQTMYQRLLLANGVHTDGTLMFQIKAAAPQEPDLLKSGKALSRADITSDWKTYEAAVIRHGFDPAEYEDMKVKLAAKEWRRLERTYRSEAEVRAIWDKIVIPVAIEIAHSTTSGSVINREQRVWNHMSCMGCWARDFCQAEMRGEDTEFLLQTKYVDWENPQDRVILNPDNFVFIAD